MGYKWINDVLADLKSFAEANDLSLLADQLEQAAKVASVEAASLVERAPDMAHSHDRHIGSVSAGSGERDRA